MTTSEPPKRRGPRLTSAEAQARLSDALRENLRRRKTQLRARDEAGAGDEARSDAPRPAKPGGKSG